MTTYSLGSDDPELARLEMQAEFIREPTRILLAGSGIAPGMRVLDLGTGLGHVAAALAEIVGPEGEVVGLDRDPRMLERARARAEGLPQVRFVEGDVTQWRGDEQFDAVVGRLILFHLPDPVGVLRHHLASVRAGGRAVIIDYDLGNPRAQPLDALTDRLAWLIRAAFRGAGADPLIGSRLQEILRAAGVEEVGGHGIVSYLSHDDPAGPAMFAGIVRSLLPAIVGQGLATEEELGIDTLQERITEAVTSTGGVIVPPVLVGAWGRVGG